MAEHHGREGPDLTHAAEVDDAAQALLAAWDAAREQATPRLSWPQLSALLVVERAEGINLRGLAGELRMLLSSASRLCDRLEATGLLRRVPDPRDRREVRLLLTPTAQRLLEDLRERRRSALAEVLERMSPTSRQELVRAMAAFDAAAGPATATGDEDGLRSA